MTWATFLPSTMKKEVRVYRPHGFVDVTVKKIWAIVLRRFRYFPSYNEIFAFVFNNKPFSLVRQIFCSFYGTFPVERRTPSKLDETFQLLAPVTPTPTSILRICGCSNWKQLY